MGIRVALGAERADVLSLVLRQGVRLAIWGAVVGLGIARFATSYLEDMLFGIGRQDPVTLLGDRGAGGSRLDHGEPAAQPAGHARGSDRGAPSRLRRSNRSSPWVRDSPLQRAPLHVSSSSS